LLTVIKQQLKNYDVLLLYISGGCNNNPTAKQFGYALRRFVAHATAVISVLGNVTVTLELPLETRNTIAPISLPLKNSAASQKKFQPQILECEFTPLSNFSKGVVSYIAGYIMRKIGESISCKDCRGALFNTNSNTAEDTQLIQLRDFGGLFFPSQGLKDICSLCESIFRHTSKALKTKIVVLQDTLIHYLGIKINSMFPAGSVHFNAASGHLLSLVRVISHRYFVLRKFHAIRLMNNHNFHTRTRFVASKHILFRGE
jgi:hypothetical protein